MKTLKYIFLTLIISAFFIASQAKAAAHVIVDKTDITGTTFSVNGHVVIDSLTEPVPVYYYLYIYQKDHTTALFSKQLDISYDPASTAPLTFAYSTNLFPYTASMHLFTYRIEGVYPDNKVVRLFQDDFDTSGGGTHVISESRPPTVYTKDIINLTGLGATLVGTVQNNKNPVTVWFKLGLKDNAFDDQTTPKLLNSLYGDENYNQASVDFSNAVEKYKGQNMVEGVLYYYVACAKNTTNIEICGTTSKTFSPKKVQVEITPVTLPPPNSDTTYQLLAPLPTKAGEGTGGGNTITIIDSTQGNVFGKYFNTMIRIFIGLCAVLSFVMIVIGGIEYVTSELMTSKEEGRKRIGNAIFGLLIALGSYVLLNTINPQLLDVSLSGINDASVVFDSSGNNYNLSQTQGTDTAFQRTSFYDQIKTIAVKQEYNIPHCLLQVAIQRESRGVTGLIGHDENVPSAGVPSRKDFIASGKKFDGTSFPAGNSTDPKITDHSFLNNDQLNSSANDLGLDWRFSHSVGLFGVTFFPSGSTKGANYNKGITVTTVPNTTTIFPKDLLNNNTTDILVASEYMTKVYKLCGSIEGTFRMYTSGSCNGNDAFTQKEAPLRKSLYDQCVAQDK